MKRINIYIPEETNDIIDNLAAMFSESRSEVIRKAISEYHDTHKSNLDNFMEDITDLIEIEDPDSKPYAVTEHTNCKDIEYFINNYVMIKTPDGGITKFKAYKHQIALLEQYTMNRRIIINQSRQMGTSTITCAHILHSILYNTDCTYVMLNVTEQAARNTLDILKYMISNMPEPLREFYEITAWKRNQITINGNDIIAKGYSVDSMRGMTINFLYMENFANVNRAIADEFITSVFPVIFSYSTSRLIITSCPSRLNHFFKLWNDAISDYNDIRPIKLHYSLHEDESYRLQCEGMKRIIGIDSFEQEYNCNFITSNRGVLDGV